MTITGLMSRRLGIEPGVRRFGLDFSQSHQVFKSPQVGFLIDRPKTPTLHLGGTHRCFSTNILTSSAPFPMSTSQADLQARQQTLRALSSIGLQLNWNAQYELAVPKALSEETIKIDGRTNRFIHTLADEAQSISFENLFSSLLAGPDNESDEPVDVPVFLGPTAKGVDEQEKTTELQKWILKSLGIPTDEQSLTVREPLMCRPSTSSLSNPNANIPYVLTRLQNAPSTKSADGNSSLSTSSSNSKFDSLTSSFNSLQPRWNFEVQIQNKTVCGLIGKLLKNQSEFESESDPSCSGVWVGLISFRVAT